MKELGERPAADFLGGGGNDVITGRHAQVDEGGRGEDPARKEVGEDHERGAVAPVAVAAAVAVPVAGRRGARRIRRPSDGPAVAAQDPVRESAPGEACHERGDDCADLQAQGFGRHGGARKAVGGKCSERNRKWRPRNAAAALSSPTSLATPARMSGITVKVDRTAIKWTTYLAAAVGVAGVGFVIGIASYVNDVRAQRLESPPFHSGRPCVSSNRSSSPCLVVVPPPFSPAEHVRELRLREVHAAGLPVRTSPRARGSKHRVVPTRAPAPAPQPANGHLRGVFDRLCGFTEAARGVGTRGTRAKQGRALCAGKPRRSAFSPSARPPAPPQGQGDNNPVDCVL